MKPRPGDDAKIADILEGAADVLDANEWIKNWYQEDEDGRAYCAVSSIRSARRRLAYHPGLENDASAALSRFLRVNDIFPNYPFIPNSAAVVMRWNDRMASTQEEVVEVMRQCAKDIRNNI